MELASCRRRRLGRTCICFNTPSTAVCFCVPKASKIAIELFPTAIATFTKRARERRHWIYLVEKRLFWTVLVAIRNIFYWPKFLQKGVLQQRFLHDFLETLPFEFCCCAVVATHEVHKNKQTWICETLKPANSLLDSSGTIHNSSVATESRPADEKCRIGFLSKIQFALDELRLMPKLSACRSV